MQDKLTAYVRNLFRNAADTQRNRELEEEILQNTLDRYEDLMNSGLTPEDAYHQAIANLGDVESLFEKAAFASRREEKGSSRAAWIAVAVVLAVILVIFGGAALLIGLNYAGPDPLERAEHKVEAEVERIETAVEQWADGVENAVEASVEDLIGHPDRKDTEGFRYRYAEESSFTVGSTELAPGGIHRLVIDWVAGSVVLETYEGSTIAVSEAEQHLEADRLRWRQRGETLTIRYCASTDSSEIVAKDLIVQVPVEFASVLRYVQIDTVSADARAADLEIGELQFDSVSGNLEFSGWAWDADLDTVSGTAEMNFADTPNELQFDSTSGDLILFLPESRSFEVDFETVSGNFHNNFGTYRQDDDAIYFEGTDRGKPAELEIDTMSGNVRIEKN